MSMKKLLALVLALTMVLSVSAAAAYTVAPYGDAEQVNEDCEVAVQTLYSMDIMKGDDKGNFRPEATITRAEVAKMIYVILNYGDDDKAVNYTGAKIFSDVKAGEWYEGYVNYMAMTKLVQGRPDGTFGPNDPVTTAEAAKMLLTAIGYSAENRGYTGAGWDKQVLSDAAIIGLLEDYDYNTTGYAPRQWVAVMFYNALTGAYTYGTIAPVVFNGLLTGTNLPSYEYKLLGEKYYNMKYFKGVVTANEYADLYGAEGITSGRTILDNNGIKLKVDTDLDDLGERRWGWYNEENNVVYYFGDTGTNTVYSTGDATTIAKKYVGVYVDEAEYYVNFDKSAAYGSSVNGDWLKVIDYNDDGDADYVFKTTFTMAEVKGLSKGGVLTLTDKNNGEVKFDDGDDYIEFVTESELAYDDVVLYTVIDGVCYVELAPTFTGKVDKYTYKSNVLTVEGEDYTESAIAQYTSCIEVIANARKNIEYTYYQDFFGHIRVYSRSVSDAGELVLLTDAYYETNRAGDIYAVYAYLDGEITDCDVDPTYSDINTFFTSAASNNNAWGRLKAYEGNTHVARYTEDEDGLTIMDATTHYYDKTGAEAGIKGGYVDLKEEDVKAGAVTYTAEYQNWKVQANKDTVYYYVSYDAYDNMVIETVTGYKNSYDVVNQYVDIIAMYSVATRIDEDAKGNYYYVADVIVIETESPVFNLNNNVVLGYNVYSKNVNDYAVLDVIAADGSLDSLNVISHNGNSYNDFTKADLEKLTFYYNTEDENEDSHIREIVRADYAKNGIYTATIDRVNALYEYVVTDSGKVLVYDENTIVYDLEAKGTGLAAYVTYTTEDDYEDTLVLGTAKDYIVVADENDYIIYAILVESYNDVAANLYETIKGAPVDALGKAKADAAKALADYAAQVVADGSKWTPAVTVTAEQLAETVAAEQAKIAAATTEAAVATALTAAKEAVWQKALAVQAGTDALSVVAKVEAVNAVAANTGDWATVSAAIATAVDSIANVSDVTVATPVSYAPIAKGGVDTITVSVSYMVNGETVARTANLTVTVTVAA